MKKLFTLLLFALLLQFANAQPPTITSFTPASGAVGTLVTITGTNFNTTAANNVVYFGVTKAVVSAASATSLTVTVPVGATYQPITEINIYNGLSCASPAPFITTFTPTLGTIDANNFEPQVDFSPSLANTISTGDIDGDGKPDLVVLDNTNGMVLVLEILPPGLISGSSLAAPVSFNILYYTYTYDHDRVQVVDIDGDGKLDLVIINYDFVSSISVLRNTSTTGSVSFASKVDFPALGLSGSIYASDIDGDGKPDLVVRSPGTVSVYHNTSVAGTINSGSFAAQVDFASGLGNSNLALGDLDGDGKIDMAVSDGNNVAVYRNTSVSGTINSGSFAPQVDYPTTSGYFPGELEIGDMDGDGKQDLIHLLNDGFGANSLISVMRNISVSGSISLEPVVDFNLSWAISMDVGDIDGDGKPDLFVPSTYNSGSNSGIQILRNASVSGTINSSSFVLAPYIPGSANGGATIVDMDGDGRPDLVFTTHPAGELAIKRIKVESITTGTVTGSPFCAGADVDVPYTVNTSFQAGNVFTAQLSDASGSFASPVDIGTLSDVTDGTINATIPITTATGSGYRIRVVGSMPQITGTDNGADITINASSISTGAITGSPFCSGENVSVPFTVSCPLGSGNVFTAQLSNSSGSFASPVDIGALNDVADGTINATIPGGTTTGSGYRIRVVSSIPVLTGTDNGADITINTTVTPSISFGGYTPICPGALEYIYFLNEYNEGSAPVYSWYKNGALMPGETNRFLFDYTTVDGDEYYCKMVSNALCASPASVNSNTFTASVINTIQTWYEDGDGDGYSTGNTIVQCGQPGGYYDEGSLIALSDDCEDADNTKWQNALLYIDGDNDNYDNGTETVCYGASVPVGYSETSAGTDCNDGDAAVNPGAANCVDLTCADGVFYDSGGDGADYSDNETTTTVICPDNPGEMVAVDFSLLDIENDGLGFCYDFLSIHDGPDNLSPLIGNFCEFPNLYPGSPGLVVALEPSGCLTFVFTSDGSVTEAGWEAAISCLTSSTCEITSVVAGFQFACVPQTLQYSNEITIEYTDAPLTGTLDVNGQSFSITGSPQTVTLTGLIADGGNVDVSVSFSDDPQCSFESLALFTAPDPCPLPPADSCSAFTSIPGDTINSGLPPAIDTLIVSIPPEAINGLDIAISLSHTYLGDLTIQLQSPEGTVITLMDGDCSSDMNLEVVFDDQSGTSISAGCNTPTFGSYQPTVPLGIFDEERFNGIWILTVTDNAGGDNGKLLKWCLFPTLVPCPVAGTPCDDGSFCTIDDAEDGSCNCVGTIEDFEPPVAFCQDIIVQLNAAHSAVVTPQDIDNGSYDDCNIASLSLSVTDFDCDDLLGNISSNYAVQFDGIDGFINAGENSEQIVSAELTLEAWIYPTGAGSGGPGGFGGVIINKEGEYQLARWDDGTIRWAVANTAPGWVWVNTGQVVPLNDWTHVALTYDGSAVSTYINGSLIHTQAASGIIGDDLPSENEFRIGCRQGAGGSQFFDGSMDEIRLWNRGLSAGEVSNQYHRALSGNESGLIGYWRMEEGSGTSTDDRSPSNKDGSLENGATWTSTGAPLISQPGVNEITLTVTDFGGNEASCFAHVTIAEDDFPCITCADAGTPCDDGDPCTINDLEDGFCNCIGAVDTEFPVIQCPNNLTVFSEPGLCGKNIGTELFQPFDILIDFEDDSDGGWVMTDAGNPLPVNVPSGGSAGAGDNYLQLESAGGLEFSAYSPDALGDLLNTNLSGIAIDLNNIGSVDVYFRIQFESPSDTFFTINAIYVPASSGWQHFVIPFRPQDLTGGMDVMATLSNVTSIRFFHNPDPFFPGPTDDILLGVDNMQPGTYFAYEIIASDNCSVQVDQTGGLGPNSFFPLGETVESYTATDPEGNSVSCDFTISVIDTSPPVGICQNITVQLGTSGNVTITPNDIDNGSSDDCGIASRYLSHSAFTCNEIGANSVTLFLNNLSGYESSCTSTVTIEDKTAPIVSCQNISVSLDVNGNASITAAQINNGNSDACGGVSLGVAPTSFTCSNVGANVVLLTATDDYSNASTCTAVVLVNDVIAPDVVCNNAVLQLDNTGNLILAINLIAAYSDVCGVTAQITPRQFDCNAAGFIHPVLVEVNDVHGNAASCISQVTIKDAVAPEITCQDLSIYLDSHGESRISFVMANTGFSDECNVSSKAISKSLFKCIDIGTNTITLSATDNAGNIGVCTSVVTVLDTIKPKFKCSENIVVGSDAGLCGANVIYNAPYFVKDNCGWILVDNSLALGSGSLFPVGITTETYKATDGVGLIVDCTFDVLVMDMATPSIACPPSMNVNAVAFVCGAVVNYSSPSVSDNCAGGTLLRTSGFASNTFFPLGRTTIGYAYTDDEGHSAHCSFKVYVKDVTAPDIICTSDVMVTADPGECGAYVTYDAPTINDDCPGVTMEKIAALGSGAYFPIGVTTESYEAKDTFGNVSPRCNFTVTVLDNGCIGVPKKEQDLKEPSFTEVRAFPNPFSGSTFISFRFKQDEKVKLEIFDAAGKKLTTLFEGNAEADRVYTQEFDATKFSKGIYLYRIVTESGETFTGKLIFINN